MKDEGQQRRRRRKTRKHNGVMRNEEGYEECYIGQCDTLGLSQTFRDRNKKRGGIRRGGRLKEEENWKRLEGNRKKMRRNKRKMRTIKRRSNWKMKRWNS